MDNVSLGRKGEVYVLQKVLSNGWSLPPNYIESMDGLDWVFQKDNRIIKVQVKTSEKTIPTFSVQGLRTFDYLIFTNLKDCWIIHKFMINNSDRLSSTLKKFKNHFELLDLEGSKLLSAINDCGVRFYEINNTSRFLNEPQTIQ